MGMIGTVARKSGWDGCEALCCGRDGPFLRGGKPLRRLQKTEGQNIERFKRYDGNGDKWKRWVDGGRVVRWGI